MMRKLHWKKMLVSATLAICSAVVLWGCSCKKVYFSTGLSSKEIFKINGAATTLQEAMLYLTCEKNLYENSYGSEIWSRNLAEGMTLMDYVKDTVKERLAQVSALNQLAKSRDISLNKNEKRQVEKAAEAFFNGLTQEEIDYMDVNLKSVTEAYQKYALAEKVYEELTKNVNPNISDADALVIKVQSIYVATYSVDGQGNRTDYSKAERKAAKEKIQGLLEDVKKDGSDFAEIASKNSDAEQVEYVFGKGEMVEEFEQAAFALKEDQISKVVTTDSGYYIIKCIEDYMIMETQENKERLISEAKDQAFKEIYKPYLESVSSEFNDKLWDSIVFEQKDNIKTCNFYDIYNKYMTE